MKLPSGMRTVDRGAEGRYYEFPEESGSMNSCPVMISAGFGACGERMVWMSREAPRGSGSWIP
jgi:hypothetical protein